MNKFLARNRPIFLITLFNLMAFFLLFLKISQKEIVYSGFFVIGMIYLVFILLKLRKMGDVYLFLIVSMLVSLGLAIIFRLEYELGIKQIIWFAAGIILFLVSYLVYTKVKFWNSLTYFYIGLAVFLFLVTLIFGKKIGGATNWIVIGGVSIQPSEFIKIIFVFFLASYYNHPEMLKIPAFNFKGRKIDLDSKVTLSIVAYVFMGFLVLQREWGGAVLLFLIHIFMLFVFEEDAKVMGINILLAIIGGSLGVLFVHHIRVRIDAWLNPWADISGKGYQITQSLFAIGSGGFFGTGLGLGSPKYIPEVETDFIFSAICEEMGIFGGVAVILLYFIMVYRGFKIALSLVDNFSKAIALGITLMFAFQTFVIIGGVIKLIPLTGITLPFISYGGSSLTTSFIALGILQALSKDAYGGGA